MCGATKALNLCTCSDKIDKSKPYWTLARKTIKQPDAVLIIGEYMLPEAYCDSNVVQTEAWLLSQLNNHQCFDFNYEPFQEDKLTIHLSGYKLGFVYLIQEQSWEAIDLQDPFLEKMKRSVQAKGYVEQGCHVL